MLHEALRLLRVYHSLKGFELAQRLDISPSYLSEIESGKKEPSLELLGRYSKEFGIPTSSILFFSESFDSKVKKHSTKNAIQKKIASKIVRLLKAIEEAGEEESKNLPH